jgi:hypothetical protein
VSGRRPVRVAAWLFAVAAGASACGARQRPAGPPPEYEKPVVTPWDAGAPVDPLAAAEATGEVVDDTPEAEAGAPGDGAVAE